MFFSDVELNFDPIRVMFMQIIKKRLAAGNAE